MRRPYIGLSLTRFQTVFTKLNVINYACLPSFFHSFLPSFLPSCIPSLIHSFIYRNVSSRLVIQKRSFSQLGVKVWNEIPSHITDLRKKTFKVVHVLCQLLFDVLEKEDDYIEIPMINENVALN